MPTKVLRSLTGRAALVTLVAVVAASCGGGSSSPSPTTKAQSTTTTPLGTGPAETNLSVKGDAGLTGALSKATITCSYPSLDGLSISVVAQAPDPTVSIFVSVSHAGVYVRVASGTAATYHERDFAGIGVGSFDPARGAQLTSSLQERAATLGKTAGTLSAVQSIAGDITCGGQRPGSSTIVLSGETGDGVISGKLDPVRVSCETNALGSTIAVAGVARVGTKRAIAFVNGIAGTFTVTITAPGGASRFFISQGAGSSKPTAQGLHVSGDAIERDSTRAKHTVHVVGDAVCGNPSGK